MMTPTVGRKVWVFGAPGTCLDSSQPFDGTIIFVQPGAQAVTVAYRDHIGGQLQAIVSLREPAPGTSSHGVNEWHDGSPRAVWMPYQVGQARAQAIGAAGPVTGG